MAAGPAAAILPSLARAASALQIDHTAAPFQRVNVLFHGLSVIAFGREEVRVYLPDAGTDRGCLAGTWMQEIALARGEEYRFSGVMTGPRPAFGDIEPRENATFAKRPVDASLSYCELVFPFPDFVTPLRLMHKSHGKNFFLGSPQPIVEPKAIPQIVAFTYTHPDTTSPLQFRPLAWTPVVLGGVVNLHVWDVPVKAASEASAIEAIGKMTKMIRAPALGLNPVYDKIEPPRPDEKPEVEGLGCDEEWGWMERMNEPEGCGKHRKYDPKNESCLDSVPIILY